MTVERCVVVAYHLYGRRRVAVGHNPRWWAEAVTQEDMERWVMSIVRKVSGSPDDGRQSNAPGTSQLGPGTDAVWEYLTSQAYEDGSKRETSTMTLFWGPQGLTATLNDRDNSRAIFANGTSLGDILELLEDMLTSPDTIWRHDRNKTGSSARKKP